MSYAWDTYGRDIYTDIVSRGTVTDAIRSDLNDKITIDVLYSDESFYEVTVLSSIQHSYAVNEVLARLKNDMEGL